MEGLELSTATLSVLRLQYENSAVWEGQARAGFLQLPRILPLYSQHWHLCHSALGCVSPGRDGVSRSEVTFTCMIIWIHVSRSHEGILER